MPTIEAHITKVEHDVDTGWYRILTDDDQVKRLDTKIAEKAKEAAEIKRSGLLAQIDYSQVEGRLNERTGKPYVNRRYERAGSLGEKPQPEDDGIDEVKPTSRKTDPGDAWRMCLNKGGELAVNTIPHLEQRSFEAQKLVAYAWAEFFYTTPPPPSAVMPTPHSPFSYTPAGSGNGAPPDGPPEYTDDDIPF